MAFRKLTPDVKDRLLQAVQLGATYTMACQYAGVSEDSFARYRKDASFADAVKEAEARGVMGWLAKIEKAANEGTWQAAAWKLERRYPEQYGRTVQEHRGDPERPLRVTLVLGEREPAALDQPTPLRALDAG